MHLILTNIIHIITNYCIQIILYNSRYSVIIYFLAFKAFSIVCFVLSHKKATKVSNIFKINIQKFSQIQFLYNMH